MSANPVDFDTEVSIQTNPSVIFDFRFDRDIKTHDETLKIRKELAEKFVREFDMPAIESLQFYPVARAGKSGSEVFYLDVYRKTVDYPRRYIAKFQTVESTINDHTASEDAAHAQMSTNASMVLDKANDIGMLVCDLARIPNHREFRAFFLDLSKSDEACATALKAVFRKIGKNPNGKSARKPLIEDFKWYVQRKSQPLARIKSLLDTEPQHAVIAGIATSIEENYNKIERQLNHPVFPYLVHGDLHARNLMLSNDDPSNTELIDFGWVHHGHPAKDFVLMECTLKYMLLRELLIKVPRENIDISLHIPLVAMEKFEAFLCRNGLTLPDFVELENELKKIRGVFAHHVQALRRVYVSLAQVRCAAAVVLETYCRDHLGGISSAQQQYYASLFLVVLGLSGFDEVEPIWTLLGLRATGDHIWKV